MESSVSEFGRSLDFGAVLLDFTATSKALES